MIREYNIDTYVSLLAVNAFNRLFVVNLRGKGMWEGLIRKVDKDESDVISLRHSLEKCTYVSECFDFHYLCDSELEIDTLRNEAKVIKYYYCNCKNEAIQINPVEIQYSKWINLKEFNQMCESKEVVFSNTFIKYAVPNLVQEGLMR